VSIGWRRDDCEPKKSDRRRLDYHFLHLCGTTFRRFTAEFAGPHCAPPAPRYLTLAHALRVGADNRIMNEAEVRRFREVHPCGDYQLRRLRLRPELFVRLLCVTDPTSNCGRFKDAGLYSYRPG
jgi:hypothetical protein